MATIDITKDYDDSDINPIYVITQIVGEQVHLTTIREENLTLEVVRVLTIISIMRITKSSGMQECQIRVDRTQNPYDKNKYKGHFQMNVFGKNTERYHSHSMLIPL